MLWEKHLFEVLLSSGTYCKCAGIVCGQKMFSGQMFSCHATPTTTRGVSELGLWKFSFCTSMQHNVQHRQCLAQAFWIPECFDVRAVRWGAWLLSYYVHSTAVHLVKTTMTSVNKRIVCLHQWVMTVIRHKRVMKTTTAVETAWGGSLLCGLHILSKDNE